MGSLCDNSHAHVCICVLHRKHIEIRKPFSGDDFLLPSFRVKDQTQDITLGGKCLHPQSLLASLERLSPEGDILGSKIARIMEMAQWVKC